MIIDKYEDIIKFNEINLEEYKNVKSITNYREFESKIDPLKKIKIQTNCYEDEHIFFTYNNMLHRNDGPASFSSHYYDGIFDISYYQNGVNYNPNGKCSRIKYDDFGDAIYAHITNEKGLISNVNGPAIALLCNGKYLYKFYICGIFFTEQEFKKTINKVKNEILIKNINRYKDINKLKVFKEIAKSLNYNELIEKIDDSILILKLQNKI